MPTKVRQLIVYAKGHIGNVAFLYNITVDVGFQNRFAYVNAAHNAWPKGTKPVHSLHPGHTATIGFAEVLSANIIGRCKTGNVVPGIFWRDVFHWATNDRRHLTFIVQILAVARAVQHAPVSVYCCDRFLEIGWRHQIRRSELNTS